MKNNRFFSIYIVSISWENRQENWEKNFPLKVGKSMSGPFRPVFMKKPDIASGGKKGFPDFLDGIH